MKAHFTHQVFWPSSSSSVIGFVSGSTRQVGTAWGKKSLPAWSSRIASRPTLAGPYSHQSQLLAYYRQTLTFPRGWYVWEQIHVLWGKIICWEPSWRLCHLARAADGVACINYVHHHQHHQVHQLHHDEAKTFGICLIISPVWEHANFPES